LSYFFNAVSAISDVRSCVNQARQAVDNLPRRAGIRLVARLRRVPQGLGRLDGGPVDALRRRDAGLVVADVVDHDAAERDVAHALRDQAIGQRHGRRRDR